MSESSETAPTLFSSVITPIRILPLDSGKRPDTHRTANILNMFATTLVRSSASRIYLVADHNEEMTSVLNELPAMLANRIELVDKQQKMNCEVANLFQPIYEEADDRWKADHDGKAENREDRHEHTVCILMEFLHLLLLGQEK